MLDEGDGSASGVGDESVVDVDELDLDRETSPPSESARLAASTSSTSLADEARSPSVEDLSKKKQQSRLSGSGLRAPTVGKGMSTSIIFAVRSFFVGFILMYAEYHYLNL